MAIPDPATTEWVPIWNPTSEGPVGPAGPTGPQGIEGPQGIQGVQGEQGPIGPTPELLETFVTVNTEATLTNSSRLVGGTNITLDTATLGQIVINGVSVDLVPIGSIMAFGGTTAPTKYLLCNGAAVSRTTYAALFAILAIAFGAGDGSTTFNLPNLQQRFPLGKAISGTGVTLGSTGGTVDHTHSIPGLSVPSLSVSVSSLSANAAVSATTAGSGVLTTSAPSPTLTCERGVQDLTITGALHTHTIPSHTHTFSDTAPVTGTGSGATGTGTTGVGTSGSGNPPFQVVNYIIKAL